MSPNTRRSYLALLAAVGAGGVAGCLGGPEPGIGSAESPRPGATETPTTSPRSSPTPTETPEGPVRPRGDPVTVERSIADQPGYEDDIEYFPSNETVRFVSARSGDEPIAFDSWSFEEWGSIRCAEVGAERVREVTANRLGTDGFSSGYGSPPESSTSDELVIWLGITTQLDREGEVVSTPTVAFSTLVENAPRSADVTVSLDGDPFSRSVDVFARTETLQLD